MKNTKEIAKNRGITLIALVITIIVLLIIAGISVAALTGNNGILTQADRAKDSSNREAVKEKVEVEALGSIDKRGNFNKETFKTNVEKNLKGSSITEKENSIIVKIDGYKVTIDGTTGDIVGEPSKIVLVKPGVTVSKTEEDNYSDGVYNATIPEGFTVDKKENIISKGLVVYGPDESEFVWVPVPDINSMAQCSIAGGDCNLKLDGETLKCTTHNNTEIVGKLYSADVENNDNIANTIYDLDKGLREPAYLKSPDYGDESKYNTIGLKLSEMQTDYKNMATSVAKYGGFYVGRYETSLSNSTETEAKDGEVQSKPGVIPATTDKKQTYMWYGIYKKQNKTYTGTNNSVESSMIWGSQYDRIINWVKEGTNEEDKAKLTNTELGNRSKEITTTGNSSNSNDSVNNIRDLGGNIEECTLEASNNLIRVSRGGCFNSSNSLNWRNVGGAPSNSMNNRGSRLTLFIKDN